MTTSSKRDEQRQLREAVLGDGSLEIDLSEPPSREDLALAEGDHSTVLQPDEAAPFMVTVRFSDSRTLTTSASSLGVTAADPESPPSRVIIRRDGMTVAELEEVLRESVGDFGADPARVVALIEGARGATNGQVDFRRSLPTALAGPERLDIQPIVTALEGRASVNYTVTWGQS